MNKLILIAVFFVTGCAQITPSPFTGPSGKQAYSMKCSGGGRSIDACYQKAGELCPSGYSIIDSTSDIVGATAPAGFMISSKRNLAIECK